jgi:hypothetical protein
MKFDCDKPERHADYDFGAQARLDGEPFDRDQPSCWQEGWKDMHESLKAEPGLVHPY